MPRIKRTKRPARPHPPSDDSDDDSPDELATTAHAASDDSDDSSDELATTAHAASDELAEFRAKEAQRWARRRAAKARYRARHPERVAVQKRRYRRKCKGILLTDEDDDDEMANLRTSPPRYRTRSSVQKRRDYEKHRAERLAYYQRYYQTHTACIRRYQRQYHRSERGRAVWPKRRKLCALANARGPAERERTAEKLQALGPLSLTVSLEDFMQGFWDSLSPAQEDSVDLVSPRTSARGPTERERTVEKLQALGPLSLTVSVEDVMQGFLDSLSPAQEAMTIMDMDSGALHPLDSSCDMWDDGRGFLDNLLQELSDLPSPSDNSLYGLLRYLGPWSPQDSDFDLEDFLS